MLAERLREHAAEGIVVCRVLPETPFPVEYHLTEKGRGLGAVTEAIFGWASEWLVKPAAGGARPEADAPVGGAGR